MTKAFLMADMTPTAGRGHAVRAVALSEALIRGGFDSALVYDLDTVEAGYVRKAKPDVVVLDSYKIWDEMFNDTLADFRPRLLVAIADMEMQDYPVDLLVNGCAGATDLTYSKAKRYMQGPAYALIREPFHPQKEQRFGIRDFRDVTGMTAGHLAALMHVTEVGISAGGMRALELAATGTPAVLVQEVENQRLNIDGLVAFGAAVAFDPERHRTPEALAESLDANVRVSMGFRGSSVVDGLGADRVVKAIKEML